MTTKEKNIYIERLETLEAKVRRLEANNRRVNDLLDLVLPLAQWATQEIITQQSDKLELDKRLGIKKGR